MKHLRSLVTVLAMGTTAAAVVNLCAAPRAWSASSAQATSQRQNPRAQCRAVCRQFCRAFEQVASQHRSYCDPGAPGCPLDGYAPGGYASSLRRCLHNVTSTCVAAVKQGGAPQCTTAHQCCSDADCSNVRRYPTNDPRITEVFGCEEGVGICVPTDTGNYCLCYPCRSDADCTADGYGWQIGPPLCDTTFGYCHSDTSNCPSSGCVPSCSGTVCSDGTCCRPGYVCDESCPFTCRPAPSQ